MVQKIILSPILRVFLAASLLLIFYFATVTLISGWDFAQSQFAKYWYFILSLAFGFGIQVGLYTYLKNSIQRQNISAKILTVSGSTSGAAMISCCSHYLVNILPILGISGFITYITQYQVHLFWLGITVNFIGITYMANKVYRFSKVT